MGLLYMIHFGDMSRFYIGATTMKRKQRRRNHLKALARGRSGPLLQAEYDRCGAEAFTFTVLREFPVPELYAREAEALHKLAPALNVVKERATLARKLGIHPSTLARRIARGVDVMSVQAKRVTYERKVPTRYNVARYDVGEGEMLTVPEIARRGHLSPGTVRHRIQQGVRGPALLDQSTGGRPKKKG